MEQSFGVCIESQDLHRELVLQWSWSAMNIVIDGVLPFGGSHMLNGNCQTKDHIREDAVVTKL